MFLLNHLLSQRRGKADRLPARLNGKASHLLCALMVLAGVEAMAQNIPQALPTQPSKTAQPKITRRHAADEAKQSTQAPEVAPAPEPPKWPANDAPAKPEVTWDSHGLRIAAANSSLHQILNDVSTATGAKVEGMGSDERVFGEYGPGDARDVLSQLLHGSSYNVLMIGDQGKGTPREIVLSARRNGSAPSPGNAEHRNPDPQQDEDMPEQPEQEEQGPPPQLMQPPLPQQQGPPVAPGTPRTPQQLLQELQERQQEMQNPQNQQQMPQQPIPSPQD